MAKNLVIVESPAKAKTIQHYLGSSYKVIASNGHVRDLPKSQIGVDTKNDFEPKYITIRGKADLVKQLKKEASLASKVYLATDPDREGEAISWHLATLLGLPLDAKNRITFNEITKNAVQSSLKNARTIDTALVDAQQARRILDRLVGYEISPVLWKKVRKGLSAGRVQSAALKLLSDRENEIADFTAQEYWTIDAVFTKAKAKGQVAAKLTRKDGEKVEIGDEVASKIMLSQIQGAVPFAVTDIKNGTRSRKAPLPFTTSTLQQEASKRLGLSPQKTMQIAQQLYEGIDFGSGLAGLITYLRTDSTRISDEAKDSAVAYIEKAFGRAYIGQAVKAASTKRIQDAHEAIRPTAVDRTPESMEPYLNRDQNRLYKLIYERFLASQMAAAQYDTLQITIESAGIEFVSSGARMTFAGFMKVYKEQDEEREKYETIDGLKVGDRLDLSELKDEQHFTQSPSRFTEATLIKALEENGVGRPSTYAPIIGTLTARTYITKEKKLLYVTELGQVVNRLMCQSFKSVVDIGFTAEMESRLDSIEEDKADWKKIVGDFYQDFSPMVQKAAKEVEKIKIADPVTDVICDKCGRNMVLKTGRFGKFYACPGFPECRNTKAYIETIGVHCPDCGQPLLIRRSKKGRVFYGCSAYPTCQFVSWDKPVEKKCPKCGAYMVEKTGKKSRVVCSSCSYSEDSKNK